VYAFVEPESFVRVSIQLEFMGRFGTDNDYLYRFYREGKSYLWWTEGYGDVGKSIHLTLHQLNEFTPHNRISEWIIDMKEQNRYKSDVLSHETV